MWFISGIASSDNDVSMDSVADMTRIQLGQLSQRTLVERSNGLAYGYSQITSSEDPRVIEDDRFIVVFDSLFPLSDSFMPQLTDSIAGAFRSTVGPFSIMVWDKHRKVAILGRDRLGEFPLYYSIRGNALAFASTVRGVLASGLSTTALDLAAVAQFLFIKAVEHPRTFFQDIRAVLPGTFLRFERGFTKECRYWDLDVKGVQAASEREAIDYIDDQIHRFIKTVESRSPTDSVGILLSGGLDSSYLAYKLSEATDKHIDTFHMVFDVSPSENLEADCAREVADYLDTSHHEVTIGARSMLQELPSICWAQNSPAANSGYMLYFASRDARSRLGIEQLYVGEGADTLFGLSEAWTAYQHLDRLLWLREIMPISARLSLANSFSRILYHTTNIIDNRFLLGLFNYFENKQGRFYWKGSRINEENAHNLFRLQFKNQLGSISPIYRAHMLNSGADDLIRKLTFTVLKTYTPNQQLVPFNLASAYNNSSTILPFLHVPLLEYCVRLPASLKERGGRKKYILAKMSEGIIPQRIINRRKAAFIIPFEHWLRAPLRPLMEYCMSPAVIDRRGLLDSRMVSKMHHRFLKDGKGAAVDIWSFVVLEVWLETYLTWCRNQEEWKSIPRINDLFPEISL